MDEQNRPQSSHMTPKASTQQPPTHNTDPNQGPQEGPAAPGNANSDYPVTYISHVVDGETIITGIVDIVAYHNWFQSLTEPEREAIIKAIQPYMPSTEQIEAAIEAIRHSMKHTTRKEM